MWFRSKHKQRCDYYKDIAELESHLRLLNRELEDLYRGKGSRAIQELKRPDQVAKMIDHLRRLRDDGAKLAHDLSLETKFPPPREHSLISYNIRIEWLNNQLELWSRFVKCELELTKQKEKEEKRKRKTTWCFY